MPPQPESYPARHWCAVCSQPLPIVVEVVIHNGGTGFLILGDMRQQTGTAEQVHEYRIVRVTLQHLDKLLANMRFCPTNGSGADKYCFLICVYLKGMQKSLFSPCLL